ncbi:hypothetical protein T4D_13175 [Trichinella pseudospiralis]|uniref:Uncharacterized protein n=1 Tax=Trichinella pseudospiralis TaxID=6337 RepID=A0A0V1FX71_TRIPS|nr:hypothetical protein T4D_13175 [Trichinella pseudospiralis]
MLLFAFFPQFICLLASVGWFALVSFQSKIAPLTKFDFLPSHSWQILNFKLPLFPVDQSRLAHLRGNSILSQLDFKLFSVQQHLMKK